MTTDALSTLLSRVKADAEKATPGPWTKTEPFRDRSGVPGCDLRYPNGRLLGWVMESEADAKHIVGCDPALITALVEVAEAAQEAVRRARWFVDGHSWPEPFMSEATAAAASFDRFSTALDALRSLAEVREK